METNTTNTANHTEKQEIMQRQQLNGSTESFESAHIEPNAPEPDIIEPTYSEPSSPRPATIESTHGVINSPRPATVEDAPSEPNSPGPDIFEPAQSNPNSPRPDGSEPKVTTRPQTPQPPPSEATNHGPYKRNPFGSPRSPRIRREETIVLECVEMGQYSRSLPGPDFFDRDRFYAPRGPRNRSPIRSYVTVRAANSREIFAYAIAFLYLWSDNILALAFLYLMALLSVLCALVDCL